MAPQPTYESPLVQLSRLMLWGRRAGLSFEVCWERAVRPGKPIVMVTHPNPPVGAVKWPTDRNDRVDWQVGITGSKAAWQRAYGGEQAPTAEAALRLLAPVLGRLDELAMRRAALERDDDAGIDRRAVVPSAA